MNLDASRTQVVGGVTYTIRSTTRWVDDVTGDATCGSGATKTDYMKAVSTVTFPVMGTTRPITNESIVAVPNGTFSGNTGSLIARVNDRDGAPVAGVGVSITGPGVATGSTDVGGCVLWNAMPVGGYYVDVSQPGYVDRSGASTVRKTASVISGATNSIAFEFDRAATANVSFDTSVSGTVQAATATSIVYAHGGMPQGSSTATSANPAASISSGAKLFPFPDPYAVWGGGCAGADPRTYGATTPLVTVSPGATHPVTVRLPALNLRVQKNGVAHPIGPRANHARHGRLRLDVRRQRPAQGRRQPDPAGHALRRLQRLRRTTTTATRRAGSRPRRRSRTARPPAPRRHPEHHEHLHARTCS